MVILVNDTEVYYFNKHRDKRIVQLRRHADGTFHSKPVYMFNHEEPVIFIFDKDR
uniref:Uncharacterized protein n=1 Tax=viral metagenome TaxID=1070528 RepID=A0A6M3LSW6_9ZZZZ